MLRSCLSFVRAGLLIALSLALLAILRIFAGAGSRLASLLPNLGMRGRRNVFEPQKLWASDEFGFDHAIEAYEELIDAHVGAHVGADVSARRSRTDARRRAR